MKEISGQDKMLTDAISQLHQLGELQAEVSAKMDLRPRDPPSAKGKAPAPQDKPPQTPKEALMQRMIKEREEQNGMVTAQEKKAMEKYIDAKVSALGPNATVSDLSPSEQDQMVGYIRNVNEDMLYKREGMDRVELGPVQRACENVPFITTPDYPPDPKPDVPKPAEKPSMFPPFRPQEPTTTDVMKEMFSETPPLSVETASLRLQAKYEEEMEQYEKDRAQWEQDSDAWEKWEKYENEDRPKWLEETKKLDAQSNAVERALALGVMKTDYDPDTGKYMFAFQDANGNWQKKECDSPEEVKMRANKAVSQGLVNPAAMAIPVDEDLLAAIATGDVMVQPEPGGKTLQVIRNDPNAKNPGAPTTLLLSDPDAVKDFANAMNGYQANNNINYSDIDGRAYRNAEEREQALNNATTNELGQRICSVCGQIWEGPAGMALLLRRGDGASELMRKLKYRSGYIAWEKVDAATQLTKASLGALKGKSLTLGQISALVKHLKTILGSDQTLAERFIHRLTESCGCDASVSAENVSVLTQAVFKTYSIYSVSDRMQARAQFCPLCRRKMPVDVRPLELEKIKKETVFKGPKIINEWAANNAGVPYKAMQGVAELLRDGTQQAFNPFTDIKATWTKFSYRPTDAEEGYPIISIIPASFQGMTNINLVLNTTPYVVVSEYFMRNNISSAVNLFQGALEGKADAPDSKEAGEPGAISENTMKLTDIIKNAFEDLSDPAEQAIHMPFVLYHRLKAKLYGNRYIFPYIPKDQPIQSASNTDQWGGEGILASLTSGLMNATNGLTGMLGFGIAKPFPAPTWKLPDSGNKWTFNFNLNLINDEYVRTRNNYMCANTLINNNRWIQKTIFGFPGALYEVLVPTGVRELMCTGDFKLKPLGVNRHVPHGFFDVPFKIGSQVYPTGKADLHSDAYEVVPDAYTLECTFQSCIDENLNNSVFAYYLKITDFAPGTPTDSALEAVEGGGPWVAAAEAHVKLDDAVALQQTAVDISKIATDLVGAQGEKAAAEDEKKQADAARTSEPADGGGNATGGAPAPRRPRDAMRWDSTMEAYSAQYDSLRKQLSVVNAEVESKRALLNDLMMKGDKLPLSNIRKTYSRRISKIKSDLLGLMKNAKRLEDNLIQVELTVLLHAKDKVEERVNSDTLEVPQGYFDPYVLDELTRLKIKLMTREELDKFIADKEAYLDSVDKWGIHNCRDFWIRIGVVRFIADVMGELEETIRDTYETDPETHDKCRYKYEMIQDDLRDVLDVSKPFILNRTNIVYINPDTIPKSLLSDEVQVVSVQTGDSGDGQSDSQELIEANGSNDSQLPAVIELDDGSTVVDRAALIKQHRAEVIKQVFGSEEKLASKAFKSAVENSTAAANDRDALVMLKRAPELDDEASVYEWFKTQGDAYQDIVSRLESDREGVAILPVEWTGEEREQALASLTRKQAIFYITQDLYRYVSSHRVVLLGNAMDTVNTRASAVLNRVTNEFQRLEN